MSEDVLVIVLSFGGGVLALFLLSPLVRALAERIRTRPLAAGDAGQHAAVLAELEELRREVAELAERVDFVERLQAGGHDAHRVAPPR